jgi:hypothetical protein
VIVFLTLIAAPLVFVRAFGRDDRWRPLRTYSLVTGVLGFALLVLYVVASAGTWNGLAQRTFVSVLFLWIAVVGFRLAGLGRNHAQHFSDSEHLDGRSDSGSRSTG